MTENYKTNLLKWLVGKYTTQTQPAEVINQIGLNVDTTNILKQFLSTHYTTTNVNVRKTIKSNINGNILVLCYDMDNSRSIIIIFDETLNPLQLITMYSSGTRFKDILGIGCGEDGNFFLIENTGSATRFVMCNNITSPDINGTFKVVLRKAYNVSGNLTNLYIANEIIKYPNMSKYLVVGGSATNKVDIITEIVINFGMPNEYNDFTFSTTSDYLIYGDIYYTLDGESIKFSISASGQNAGTGYNELTNTDYTITTTTYATDTPWLKTTKTSYNDAYIVGYTGTEYKFYHFVNGTFTTLGTYATDESHLIARITAYYIGKINDVIYGIVLGDYDSNNYQIRGFTIINDVLKTSGLSEGIPTGAAYFNMIMSATNNYDLYNFIYAFGNLTVTSYLIYNENRYNGSEYVDYNYFIPSYSKIFVNNIPVFARGLYNFTVFNNNSTAIVNIPNSYINDAQFEPRLYGETNGELIIGNDTYEKNIYENVLLNFNNSITIQNDGLYMNTPSARLNNSILNDLDYNNAKLGYVRINYANSVKEFPITIVTTDLYNYYANFVVMAGDDINNIMLLSNDKETIYDQFTIEYELNKIYKIKRTITIE